MVNSKIPFKGSYSDDGLCYMLEGEKGGRIKVAKEYVEISNGVVYLSEGCTVEVLDRPPAQNVTMLTGRTDKACGGGPTACIGAVEICCGSGKVIHACIGAWGCP